MSEKKRADRLPKPIIAVGGQAKRIPEHLLLARLYRFTFEGETYVLTNDRGAVQYIRRLQADFLARRPDEPIPSVTVEVVSIQKLTKLNVVKIFKDGMESIILDRETRTLDPFKQLKRYRRYRVGFERKPRKPKAKKK